MLKAKLAQLCESILQAAQLPDNLALFDARDEYLELFAVLSAMANFPGGGILLFGVSDAADGAPAQLCGVSDAARVLLHHIQEMKQRIIDNYVRDHLH